MHPGTLHLLCLLAPLSIVSECTRAPRSVGQSRDGFRTVLGAQGRKLPQGKPRICAQLSRAARNQIVSIIATCKRTTEEACTQGPLCPRTAEELFRSKPPYRSANFGGSPRTKGPREIADLGDTVFRPPLARENLPIRPYLHARISRITVVEQLPQIIIPQTRGGKTNVGVLTGNLYG